MIAARATEFTLASSHNISILVGYVKAFGKYIIHPLQIHKRTQSKIPKETEIVMQQRELKFDSQDRSKMDLKFGMDFHPQAFLC